MIDIKINYVFQHDDTGYIFTKTYDIEDIEGYDTFSIPHRYSIIARRLCTERKDKNGKEIYEGDLVKIGNYVYIVEIDLCKGLFFRCIEYLSLRGGNVYYSQLIKDVKIEVIGNKFENPELLREE